MAMFTCSLKEFEEIKLPSPKPFVRFLLEKGGRRDDDLILEIKEPLASTLTNTKNNESLEETTFIKESCQMSLKSLKQAIKEVTNIDEVDEVVGVTALMCMCFLGQHESVKLLLKKHADPFLSDKNGWNALHYATWGKNLNCIKSLLSLAPALVNSKENSGMTPLMIAANRGNIDVFQILLKKGGNVLDQDNSGRTILHWAVTSKQISMVQILLTKYLSDDQHEQRTDSDGASPLHYAVIMGSVEILCLLLSKGFDPTLRDKQDDEVKIDLANGLTPVHWACAIASEAIIEALLKYNIELLTVESSEGLVPLHVVACVGSVNICQKLIENGAPVNQKDSHDSTPLHLACQYGHLDCVKLLLTHNAELESSSNQNCTGLHFASQEGHEMVVEELLENGAERDKCCGIDWNSPIHLAAVNGKEKVIETILKHGCDVDLIRSSDGRSSLHLSASEGHMSCCEVLVDKKADINRRDSTAEGFSPLDLALINDNKDCIQYLISKGGRTSGGRIHRAVSTIQLSWRFHVHKRRMAVTSDWAARVIQYAYRKWISRQRARKLMKVRERRRHNAALTIQNEWRIYCRRKRELEESYFVLKNKLSHEQMAAQLIISELHRQASNIHLPSTSPQNSKSHSRDFFYPPPPQSSLPRTAHLLRSGMHPTPLFPSDSLLFQQRPRKQLLKPICTVRLKTVPENTNTNHHGNKRGSSQTAPTGLTQTSGIIHKESVISPRAKKEVTMKKINVLDEDTDSSPRHSEDILPVISRSNQRVSQYKSSSKPNHSHNNSKGKVNTDEAISKSDVPKKQETPKLPPIIGNTSMSITSSDIQETAQATGTSSQTIAIIVPPVEHTSKSSSILPPVSSLLYSTERQEHNYDKVSTRSSELNSVSRHSRKEFDQSYDKKSGLDSQKSSKNSLKKTALHENEKEKKRQQKPSKKETLHTQEQSLLMQHAQRYNKLQEVMILLEQAKHVHREAGTTDSNYDDLKIQIQSALEEAIRLRADTEDLYDKLSVDDSK